MTLQTGINEVRLFETMRLHPWIPEQKKLIDGMIARLGVVDPPVAEEYRRKYQAKLETWKAEQPAAEAPEVVPPVVEPVEEEKAPPKPKRKKKDVSPS